MFGVKGLNKRDMKLSQMCYWKSKSFGAWHFNIGWALPSVPNDRDAFFFSQEAVDFARKMKAPKSFETPQTTHPTTQCHTPKGLHLKGQTNFNLQIEFVQLIIHPEVNFSPRFTAVPCCCDVWELATVRLWSVGISGVVSSEVGVGGATRDGPGWEL